ncbi:MAG: hypothetical protein HY247_05835 [archaeon]|nr:MAG: hypothetical protein HY247_05835 [archaeon]
MALVPTAALGSLTVFFIPIGLGELLTDIAQLSLISVVDVGLGFYTAIRLRNSVEALHEFIETDDEAVEKAFESRVRGLSSIRGVLLVWVLLLSFFVPLFTLGPGGDIYYNLTGEIPYLYSNFLIATFFWVFGYSMFSIYRIGKLPLRLKPYTQDKTLGTRPFAAASLRFSLIYLAIATFLSLAIIFGGALPLSASLLVPLVLYPPGFLFFLLPLYSIHRKLVEAKSREMAWLEPWATAVLRDLKSTQRTEIDQRLVNEITAIDKVQRDIQQIHTWPFDTGIVIRLAAVIFSLLAILISAIIRDLFKF